MVTISLCMIVKDEEDVLERCLLSVRDLVEEIVVVDTGSSDGTKEIARRCADRVYDFPWVDDFSAARNFAFSKAQMDYCMWLDADDVLREEDRGRFRALKETLEPDVTVVMMKYNTGFDAAGNVTFSYYRERLIQNHVGMRWEGAIHEAITPRGKVIYSDVAVTHDKLHPSDPDRNLRIFERLLREGKTFGPREQYYYARELYDHRQYQEAVEVLRGFLKNEGGFLENQIDACRLLAECLDGIGEEDAALDALFCSFRYDRPRAEVCCAVGLRFMRRARYDIAAYWYEVALTCSKGEQSVGFVEPDCYGYIPCMQLCVCYDRLGDRELAREYNERAGAFKPQDPAYLYNRDYFSSIGVEGAAQTK